MEFSNWKRWLNRNQLGKVLKYPGIYVVRYTTHHGIEDTLFEWTEDIICVGMTNSIGGLKGRLSQFNDTMRTARVTHGGADRVRFKHQNYSDFASSAYVAVCHMVCDVESNKPEDLRKMGKVAEWEYLAMAAYVEKFGRLPEFNDKKATKKFSKST